jgi:hypothetical protein
MTTIQEDLNEAITFIRSSRSAEFKRDRLIEQLTRDLIHLDGTEPGDDLCNPECHLAAGTSL